jgi:transcriptional regulator with XRE-family HTH domain
MWLDLPGGTSEHPERAGRRGVRVLAQPDDCGHSARRADSKRAPAPTHDGAMTHDSPVTRAPVVPSGQAAPSPTRARRWGEVPPEEQRKLRAGLGTRLWIERASAGMTQRQLAERAGLAESTVRGLETGRQRPSDQTCRQLARALRPHTDAVTQEVLTIELETLAGDSLRPRTRHRPPRASRERIRALAREVLTQRLSPESALSDLAMAMIEPAPDDPWSGGRRPAVGG